MFRAEALAKTHNNIVFDTFLLNIKIWSEYKYNSCDSWIIDRLHSIHFDYVFLTAPDVSWRYDPLRENEDNRDELYDIFQKELSLLNWDFIILEGESSKRKEQLKSIL